MANFTWKDEDDLDGAWDTIEATPIVEEDEEVRATDGRSQPKYKLIILAAVILLALSTSGGVWFYNRAQEINTQFNNEVISSHLLYDSALREHDTELFIALLSGSDARWAQGQIKRFDQGQVLNRHLLDLTLMPDGEYTTQVELSADYSEATVTTTQQYQDIWGHSFPLELVDMYRPGAIRWLLAPLPEESWGEWETISSDDSPVTLTYLQRDHQLAEPLFTTITELIQQLCQPENGHACPHTINIGLERHVDLLVKPEIVRSDDEGSITLVLPTMSLIGVPTEPVGREALLQAYSRLLLDLLLNHVYWDTPCCDGRHQLLDILAQQQSAELGLTPHDSNPEDYAQFFAHPFPLSTSPVTPFPIDISEPWQSRLLIDYLHTEKQIPLGTIGTQVDQADLKSDWLSDIIPDETAEFTHFIYDKYQQENRSAKNGIPTQDIATVCMAPDNTASTAYRYQPNTERWTSRIQLDGWSSLHISPNDQQRIRSINTINELATQTILYYSDVQADLPTSAIDYTQERRFVVDQYTRPNHIGFTSLARNRGSILYHEIDSENCAADKCPIKTYPGLPTWSPDNIHYLTSQPGQDLALVNIETYFTQYHGRSLGDHTWLDATRFLYSQANETYTDLIITQGEIGQPHHDAPPLFSISELLQQASTNTVFDMNSWFITHLQTLPTQEDILLLHLVNQPQHISYIFFVNWQTGELQGEVITNSVTGTIRLAPNGRWLLWEADVLWEADDLNLSTLIDLETFTTVRTFQPATQAPYAGRYYNRFDWSADGRWLLHFDHAHMTLIDPEQNNTTPILYPHNLTTCNGGGFIATP